MTVRVALDLDGSLESLTNSMGELASALRERDDLELRPFRSRTSSHTPDVLSLRGRRLLAPLWRRSMGPSIDRQLGAVDLVHVAGVLTPPTKHLPLLISVDDLRPFRDDAKTQQHLRQLQRALERGARIVASSRTAAHEVQDVLGLAREQFAVVRPPVGSVGRTTDGKRLVINVTGQVDRFLFLAPTFTAFAQRHGADMVVVGSSALATRLRADNVPATFLHRSHATQAIAQARVVVNMTDGARFPAFAIAALAAGVPTMARATEINRELLNGAALLVEDDEDITPMMESLWDDAARRAIAIAAGLDRAHDFAPREVAAVYASLYHDVARSFR